MHMLPIQKNTAFCIRNETTGELYCETSSLPHAKR